MEAPRLNLPDSFDDHKVATGVIASLTDMAKSPGWAWMQQIIAKNVADQEKTLKTTKFNDVAEVDRAQDLILLLEWVAELPRAVINDLSVDPTVATVTDGDPYDKMAPTQEEQTKP